MSDIVFCYGTMKEGMGNHSVIKGAGGILLHKKAETVEKYPLIFSGIPLLLNEPNKGFNVEGEIYKVLEMRDIDRLQGHPHFYKRKKIWVKASSKLNKEQINAWAYFLNKDIFNKYTYFKSYEAALWAG